jgi:hypothetical protein
MKKMNSYRLVIRPTAFDDGVHDDAGLLSKQEKEKKRKERKKKTVTDEDVLYRVKSFSSRVYFFYDIL